MKPIAFVFLLAGCYQPLAEVPCTVLCNSSNDCTGGLTCTSGRCTLANGACMVDAGTDDGAPDAVVDARPSNACTPLLPSPGTGLVTGSWFVTDRGTRRSVLLSGAAVLGTDVLDSPNISDYMNLFPGVGAGVVYLAPRLAPGGDEMFLLKLDNGAASIVASRRNTLNGMWSDPTAQTFIDGAMDVAITPSHVASAPTTTLPRRVMLSVTNGSVLDEYRETLSGRWVRVAQHPAMFGAVVVFGQPMLSPDGLRIVFVGQIPNERVSGFYADRPDLASPFGPDAHQIPTLDNLSVASPYLTADCQHYYYTDPDSGLVYHVTF